MTKFFHTKYKISHACQKVHMHVKCWCGELVFLPTLFSHGSFFSHTFHMIFTHIAQVVAARMGQFAQLRERTLCIMLVPQTKIGTISYLRSCNSCCSSIMQILKICWLLIMRWLLESIMGFEEIFHDMDEFHSKWEKLEEGKRSASYVLKFGWQFMTHYSYFVIPLYSLFFSFKNVLKKKDTEI